MNIGLDTNIGLIYQGVSNYGHGLWPSPILSPATYRQIRDDKSDLPQRSELFLVKYLFRDGLWGRPLKGVSREKTPLRRNHKALFAVYTNPYSLRRPLFPA